MNAEDLLFEKLGRVARRDEACLAAGPAGPAGAAGGAAGGVGEVPEEAEAAEEEEEEDEYTRAKRDAFERRGLDEGLLPLNLSNLLCIENPYSYNK